MQAAAVLAGEAPEAVAERWDLLGGTRAEPAEERNRQRRALLDSL